MKSEWIAEIRDMVGRDAGLETIRAALIGGGLGTEWYTEADLERRDVRVIVAARIARQLRRS